MPIEKLNYKKDKGIINVIVSIENVPSWSYKYTEDTEHNNSTASNNPKDHTLGKPHELIRPLHDWIFLLSNTSTVKIENVIIKMDWFQEQDGVQVNIHSWHPDPLSIKAEGGEILEDRIILNPV